MNNRMSMEEFEIQKERVLEELLILKYFRSEKEQGKEYITITSTGIVYLEELIEKMSKLILKDKVNWINLFTLDELFVMQTELLKSLFGRIEMALLHMATEYKIDCFEELSNDLTKLINEELIEISPRSNTLH